jgi:hypothetical protein
VSLRGRVWGRGGGVTSLRTAAWRGIDQSRLSCSLRFCPMFGTVLTAHSGCCKYCSSEQPWSVFAVSFLWRLMAVFAMALGRQNTDRISQSSSRLCVQEFPGSYLGPEIGWPDWGILCFFSVLLKSWDSTLNLATTASFYILSSSLSLSFHIVETALLTASLNKSQISKLIKKIM